MRKQTILLNRFYSATTSSEVNSNIILENGFYSYQNSNGNGITNEFNIKSFLSDTANEFVVSDFLQFLKKNTTNEEFIDIYYDDKKLSDIFNFFWSNSVLSGNLTPTSIINDNLTGTTIINSRINEFKWDGSEVFKQLFGTTGQISGINRISQYVPKNVSYTSEDSYYIPVFIPKNVNLYARLKFDLCDKKLNYFTDSEEILNYVESIGQIQYDVNESVKIESILQCFVNSNLQINENYNYSNSIINKVFFAQTATTIDEGQSKIINISLEKPSEAGNEKCKIVLINSQSQPEDINNTFPINLSWSAGEQFKSVEIKASSDFIVEQNEYFTLGLTGLINCFTEGKDEMKISIKDTTVLNKVGIIPGANGIIESEGLLFPILKYEITEGDNIDIEVVLDYPSEGGVEKAELRFYKTNIPGYEGKLGILFNTITLEWQIGEQLKIVPFNTLPDDVLENIENISIQLVSLKNVLYSNSSFRRASIFIADDSYIVKRRYTTINFPSFYRQKGRATGNQYKTQFRTIKSNLIYTEFSNSWLIEYGTYYKDETSNETNGYAIANYNLYPNYFFGNYEDKSDKIKIIIKNKGNYEVAFNGEIYYPEQEFIAEVNSKNFSISLPSNTNLILAGQTNPNTGLIETEDTYAGSVYEIKIILENKTYKNIGGEDIATHNFTLKNPASAGENTITLGTYNFQNYEDIFQANQNYLILCTKYNNCITPYDGLSCSNVYNTNAHSNIKIKGIAFIDNYQNQTTYSGFEFINNNNFQQTCGITNGLESGNAWNSISFSLV